MICVRLLWHALTINIHGWIPLSYWFQLTKSPQAPGWLQVQGLEQLKWLLPGPRLSDSWFRLRLLQNWHRKPSKKQETSGIPRLFEKKNRTPPCHHIQFPESSRHSPHFDPAFGCVWMSRVSQPHKARRPRSRPHLADWASWYCLEPLPTSPATCLQTTRP